MQNKNRISKLILSSIFLAISYVLPFFTAQIPEIGSMLCPLHIPVILCGFICGWSWGLSVGFIVPLFRSLTLGMPPLYPTAICMSFELATYGLLAGLFYKLLPKKKIFTIVTLISSMIIGRIIWGITMAIALGINGSSFTFDAFITAAFLNSSIGIIIQIILIPMIIAIYEKFCK